jgi:histidinol-phosphate phosphatase family protein
MSPNGVEQPPERNPVSSKKPGFWPGPAEETGSSGPIEPPRERPRAIFLDKDGTLIENVPYNVDPAQIRLAPGAAEALPRLHAAGYRLVVVSNQSGVARGYFEASALGPVEARLRVLLEGLGVPLAGFYFCPHHPEGVVPSLAVACDCRKPAPGLIEQAARELAIDPARSWFVGDLLDDVEAGRRGGCRTILVAPRPDLAGVPPARRPDHVAADLAEAARIVLEAPGG